MDIYEFREFCLGLPFAEETTPFDEDTLVYKIGGKMFAYTSMGDFSCVAVKCEPEVIVDLIERFDYARYAPHMSKKHWLGIDPTGDAPAGFIRDKIVNSYRLVIESMANSKRTELLEALKEAGLELP